MCVLLMRPSLLIVSPIQGESKQMPMYLSADKLHTQPQTRIPPHMPIYDEVGGYRDCSRMTHSDSFYQQLSTKSRDYMTVYSLAQAHRRKKEEKEDEEEEKEEKKAVTILFEGELSEEEEGEEREKWMVTLPPSLPAEKRPQLRVSVSRSSYVSMTPGVRSQEQEIAVLKKGLKLQHSTASCTSADSYVHMKSSSAGLEPPQQ